jgi:hypothetical protein
VTSIFRWRSWLGASVIFFLIFGVWNCFAAVYVPLSLHLNGTDALSGPGVVFSGTGDAQLLGRTSLTGLHHDDPKLDTLLVDSMTSMCAMMIGWGILILAAAWFGLRGGHPWAYWMLLLSGLIPLAYYFVIAADYARQGASWLGSPMEGLVGDLVFYVPFYPAVIAGGIALARGLRTEAIAR